MAAASEDIIIKSTQHELDENVKYFGFVDEDYTKTINKELKCDLNSFLSKKKRQISV